MSSYSEWLDGGCSCHARAPCGHCENSGYYNCEDCGAEFLDYMPNPYNPYQDDYYPDPCLCTDCLYRDTFVLKKVSRDSLNEALNCLRNQALKEAVLGEYDKNPTENMDGFLKGLLSPDLASMVLKYWE